MASLFFANLMKRLEKFLMDKGYTVLGVYPLNELTIMAGGGNLAGVYVVRLMDTVFYYQESFDGIQNGVSAFVNSDKAIVVEVK